MAHEGAGEEGDADLGVRVITKLPHPAVERVHVLGPARQDTNGHAAGEDLPVGHQICADVEQRLAAARMYAEAGHDFVEDQAGVGLLRDLADGPEELDRLQIRMTALDRFDHHGRKVSCVLADPLLRLRRPVFEDHDIRGLLAGDPWCDRHGLRFPISLEAFDEHLVEHAVVVTGEEHDFAAARHRPCKPHSGGDRLRTGIAKGRALVPGELANHLRHFTRKQRLWPDLESLAELPFDGLFHEDWTVAEHDGAEAVQKIDVFVAVNVPEIRALRAHSDQRINHFLPFRPEAGDHAGIGEHPPILFRLLLRGGRALGVALGQRGDVTLLLPRQVAGGSFRERFEWRISLELLRVSFGCRRRRLPFLRLQHRRSCRRRYWPSKRGWVSRAGSRGTAPDCIELLGEELIHGLELLAHDALE